MSKKYSLNKEDIISIIKVIGWTVASTVIAVIITTMNDIEFPSQYAVLVPIINSVLYAIKKFIEERR